MCKRKKRIVTNKLCLKRLRDVFVVRPSRGTRQPRNHVLCRRSTSDLDSGCFRCSHLPLSSLTCSYFRSPSPLETNQRSHPSLFSFLLICEHKKGDRPFFVDKSSTGATFSFLECSLLTISPCGAVGGPRSSTRFQKYRW